MKDVCELLGIKKLNTTAHHPECDGAVGYFNRTLKSMLRKQAAIHGISTYMEAIGFIVTPHTAQLVKSHLIVQYGLS